MKQRVCFKLIGISCFLTSWLFSFAGCATLGEYNSATERSEFIFISTESEIAMGKEIHAEILKEFGISSNSSKVSRLQRIGKRIAQVSDRQDYEYNFYLVAKDDINAFTTPGGNIYFFEGLFDKLRSDDEIAAVLAHETGHCAARHTVKKYQAALGYSVAGSLIMSQVGGSEAAQGLASMAADTAMSLAMSAYGRRDEYEADRLGIKYMYLAGYRLDGMIETLRILEKESHGTRAPLILSTHPYVEDRIKTAEAEIKQAPAKYKK